MTSLEVANHEEMPDVLVGSENGAGEKNKSSREELNDNDNTGSFEQSSPRGVLENSTSSAYSDSGSSSDLSSLERSSSSHWKSLIGGLLLRKKKSMARLSTFPPMTSVSGSERIGTDDEEQTEGGELHEEVPKGRPSWRSFDYQELAVATDNFSSDKLIGKGGHAEVYKGCLPDGQLVAVKRLTKRRTEDERIGDFLSELGIIAHVNHPNAAQLLGFSVEGGLHLVLQYSQHGSLASVLLHASSNPHLLETDEGDAEQIAEVMTPMSSSLTF